MIHLGEESSEHSSIDLEEYLKNRDNIPSDPSDCNKDYEDEEEDEDYEDESSSSVPQKKTRKDTARDKKRVKNEAKGKQGKGGNAPRKARKWVLIMSHPPTIFSNNDMREWTGNSR